jgi:hypothetical protein
MNKHEEILSKYETTLFNKNGQPVKAVTLINAGEALKEYGETLAASPASPVREAQFLNKLLDLIGRYRSQTGETGVGNHVENEIKEYLAARTEGDGWVMVSDRLPELKEDGRSGSCQIQLDDGSVMNDCYVFGKMGWCDRMGFSQPGNIKIIKWRPQPLPSPPKTT